MRTGFLVFLIFLLGAFLRFFLIHNVPPGLYPDEAMNGLDALHTAQNLDFKVFYPENNGREGLYMNLQAVALQIFPTTATTLRAVSAAAGALTILFIYALAREFGRVLMLSGRGKNAAFSNVGAPEDPSTAGEEDAAMRIRVKVFALSTAFLAAIAAWHIIFSRIGFRAILLPLLSAALFVFIFRAMRERTLSYFIFAGITLALTLYTYIPSRLLPLLVIIPIIADLTYHREIKPALLRRWIIFAVAFSIAILPLAGYFVANPQDFLGRAGDVSLLAQENPVRAGLTGVFKTLTMFHWQGDFNWRHNVAGAPLFDIITGVLLLIGMGIALVRIKRHWLYSLLFLWLGAMLLPGMLAPQGAPHALRVFGAFPPLMLFAGLGALFLYEELLKNGKSRALAALGIISILLIALPINVHRYFFAWASSPHLDGAFRTDLVRVAEKLERLEKNAQTAEEPSDEEAPELKRYVIVNEGGVLLNGVPMPSATIRFLTQDDPTITYLTPDQVAKIEPVFDRTVIIPTRPPSEELKASLRALFPSITETEERGVFFYRL